MNSKVIGFLGMAIGLAMISHDNLLYDDISNTNPKRIQPKKYAGRNIVVFSGSGQHESKKVQRNAPCTCGSGLKFKKCCGK